MKRFTLLSISFFISLHAISLTPISVSVTADTTNVCDGTTVFLSAAASGGDGVYTYSWIPNIGSSPGPLPYTAFATTTVVVIVTDSSGSPAGIDSVVITVHPHPIALFDGSNRNGCIPLNSCFYDSTFTFNDTATHWNWDFGDGTPPDTNQNPCHIYSVASLPGFYNVILTTTTNAGCSSSFTATNYIAALPLPIAAFTAVPQYVLVNQYVQFYDSSIGAVSGNWDFGDGEQDIVQNPVHYYIVAGNYLVCLTVVNAWGCTDTLCDTVYVVTGIDEPNSIDTYISLSPNPTTDELRIENGELKIRGIEIYDVLGQEYNSAFYIMNSEFVVDVSSLPAGVYFVSLTADKGNKITRRFVKM